MHETPLQANNTNRGFTASIGPVILSPQWKQYEIDLRDKDLAYISGGFAWIANVDDNSEFCTFYIDDIHYE